MEEQKVEQVEGQASGQVAGQDAGQAVNQDVEQPAGHDAVQAVEQAVDRGARQDNRQDATHADAQEREEPHAPGIAEFTDEEIAREDEFLKGLPRINIGALVMPGIWGPAHGFWVCILFYPLWIFADYMFYGAYAMPQPWTIILAVVTAVLLVAIHVGFARVAGPQSAHRAESKGISRETYLKRERIWAVVCVIIAIAALAWATYYNLEIRTVLK